MQRDGVLIRAWREFRTQRELHPSVFAHNGFERSAAYPINDTTKWASMPPPPAATYADYIRTQAEGEYAFMTGTRSFEEWDTHVETLNTVGLAEWTAQAEARARELGILQ